MIPPFPLGFLIAAVCVQPTQTVDFESEVRPILESACFRCHGPHAKRIRAHFMMSGHESLLKGGDSGAAIVPGDPDASLLIRMVRYESEDLEMPPKGQLEPTQIELLERWIEQGADWPGGDIVVSDTREFSMEEGREWWAFKPVQRPELPHVSDQVIEESIRNGIDHFIAAKLEEADLPVAPEADPRILVRRLYIDLIGMPPSFEELQDYLDDRTEGKWGRLVDSLLARDQYGERWARYWLDVVRFAQTNGYELDEEKRFIWRYRDYVIDAYNSDKPYDQFLREQLAGDEIADVTEDSLIATGFYSLGMWDTEPNDLEQADLDSKDDILRTITEGLMAVTVGCARCHDHRTDPFRQEDYYSLVSFVRNVENFREPEFNPESRTHRLFDTSEGGRSDWERGRVREEGAATEAALLLFDERLSAYLEANFEEIELENYLRERHTALGETLLESVNGLDVKESMVRRSLRIEDRLELYLVDERRKDLSSSFEGDLPWFMCVAEETSEPLPTHVLRRGLASSPLELVETAFLPVLCLDDESSVPVITPPVPRDDSGRSSSGQRLALANWIVDPSHPTTARVMVNRIWQGHFGEGLVRSPNNFGLSGELPSHPLLLDWLADEFVQSGWSIKALHRLILNSAAYRRASNFQSPEGDLLDPGNKLLWRQQMRRLDAESLHDSILSVSGALNSEAGGRGFFPRVSMEALAGTSRPGAGWELEGLAQLNRRAIYAFVKRGLPVPFLTTFDAPSPNGTQGNRSTTTVASQALTLLNGEFANRMALGMARRLIAEEGTDLDEILKRVYRSLMLRDPSEAEQRIARDFVEQQSLAFEQLPLHTTFRASIPRRSQIFFLRELRGEDALFGPRESWDYYLGAWGNDYNLTREALVAQGPFALLRAPLLANGSASFDLTGSEGCDDVGFYLRAKLGAQGLSAVQVLFDFRNQQLRLLQCNPGLSPPQVLKRVAFPLMAGVRYSVVLQIFGASAQVLIDGELAMQFSNAVDARRIVRGDGRFGVRTMGAAVHLENLVLKSKGTLHEVLPDDRGAPLESALAMFCLTVLNLNEFLYVD